MKTKNRCRTLAWSASALALLASPGFAQMHPERIADLEEQVSALSEQLAELKAELDDAEGGKDLGRLREVEADAKVLSDGGMTFVAHPTDEGAAAYQKLAEDAAWARMSERIDGAGAGAEMYGKLRSAYGFDD